MKKTITIDAEITGYEKAARKEYGIDDSSTDHCSPITDHSIPSPESLITGAPNTALSPIEANALVAVAKSRENLAHWAGQVKLCSRASVAAMAMAGLTLRALRESYFGPRHPNGGRPRKRDNSSGMDSWTSMLTDAADITARTAERWIKIADVIEAKAEAEGGDVISICQKLPWEWTPEESAQIGHTVHSICQDKTQRELLQQSDFLSDLGYEAPEKPNSSNNPLGRNGGKKKTPATGAALLRERQAAARLMFLGTEKASRVEKGSVAMFMVNFVNEMNEPDGNVFESLTTQELRSLREQVITPFVNAWKELEKTNAR